MMAERRRPLAASLSAWALCAGTTLILLTLVWPLAGSPIAMTYPIAAVACLALPVPPALALPLLTRSVKHGPALRRRIDLIAAVWGGAGLGLLTYLDTGWARGDEPSVDLVFLTLPSGAGLGWCLGRLVAFMTLRRLGLSTTERDLLARRLSRRLLASTSVVLGLALAAFSVVGPAADLLLFPGYTALASVLLLAPPLAVALSLIDYAVDTGRTPRWLRVAGAAVGAGWPVIIERLIAGVAGGRADPGVLAFAIIGALLGLAIAHGPAQLLRQHGEAASAALGQAGRPP